MTEVKDINQKHTHIEKRLVDLNQRKQVMSLYVKIKIGEEDWHGVANAAMDLSDIENQILAYKDCERSYR